MYNKQIQYNDVENIYMTSNMREAIQWQNPRDKKEIKCYCILSKKK